MSGAPYIMFKGTGYDHLMIPVENYFDYQTPVVPEVPVVPDPKQ